MIYLVAGNSNRRHGVPEDLYDSGYVEGIQILVDQEEVTVDEVLSAFSGPRKTDGAWERLMREKKGLYKSGREGTQQIRCRFKQVQALVLARFR